MNTKEIPQQIKRLSIKIQQTADQLTMPPSRLEIDLLKRLCMEQYELILMLSSGGQDAEQYEPEPVVDAPIEKKSIPAPEAKAVEAPSAENQKYTDEEYDELLKEYQDLLVQHKKQLEAIKEPETKQASPVSSEGPDVNETVSAKKEEPAAESKPAEELNQPVKKNGVKASDNGTKVAEKTESSISDAIAAEKKEKTAEQEASSMDPALFYSNQDTVENKKEETVKKEPATEAPAPEKKEAPVSSADQTKPAAQKAKPPSLDIYKLEKIVSEEEITTPTVHHVGPMPEIKEEEEHISAETAVKAREQAKAAETLRQETAAKALAEKKKNAEPFRPEIKAVKTEVETPTLTQPVISTKPPRDEEQMDLNRKLGETLQNRDLHSRLRESPLSDLKSAITINKKIAFMNNLFESSIDKYDNAIALLNSSQSLSTALQHFSGLRVAYNWGNENELAEELEDLVRRRYS